MLPLWATKWLRLSSYTDDPLFKQSTSLSSSECFSLQQSTILSSFKGCFLSYQPSVPLSSTNVLTSLSNKCFLLHQGCFLSSSRCFPPSTKYFLECFLSSHKCFLSSQSSTSLLHKVIFLLVHQVLPLFNKVLPLFIKMLPLFKQSTSFLSSRCFLFQKFSSIKSYFLNSFSSSRCFLSSTKDAFLSSSKYFLSFNKVTSSLHQGCFSLHKCFLTKSVLTPHSASHSKYFLKLPLFQVIYLQQCFSLHNTPSKTSISSQVLPLFNQGASALFIKMFLPPKSPLFKVLLSSTSYFLSASKCFLSSTKCFSFFKLLLKLLSSLLTSSWSSLHQGALLSIKMIPHGSIFQVLLL
ncbi:hypothetical protein TVAGG3_0723050 [Trichomonas vaginalis G3]|uniref:hypothetical protein n=1 Tax=Trichomonas vaginalis (strain ATCC PRA-98 / G3) TaxID=412133 RepID=UPI0021E5CA77|nr:hypothetical protein TVAGG3_0723050 [Trichomonas vaginalis G3]KAI5510718.1 hypothetical protein TVAGG3_0723050 [Trichomonas vaginalis G3]